MQGNDWKLDPAYSGLDRGYNSKTGVLAPLASNGQVNAVSRANGNGGNKFIGSPSGTDWARTFGRNPGLGASEQRTGDRGQFSSQPSVLGSRSSSPSFSFDLSPGSDRSQLNLGTGTSDFYKDRAANMDLTQKDHELYGAGSEYGFSY